MKVFYYTSASFMDSALETLQLIKPHHEVHLLIEVTDFSKNATVIQLDSLKGKPLIAAPEIMLNDLQMEQFKPYFEGLGSVHFIVHKNKRGFSPMSMFNALRVGRFMRKIGYDLLHLDNISQRLLVLAPFLKNKKMVITLHDPMPHSGEESWKINVRNKYFIKAASSFLFYSGFSRDTFVDMHPELKAPSYHIQLQPCSFARYFMEDQIADHPPVLFWGRLSTYKGIDILLKALPSIVSKYPEQRFVIAGKPSYDFQIDEELIRPYAHLIKFIPSYLSMKEAVMLIQHAKFIVCPYRDATQSGVLATAFALGKTAVVTNAGSFGEYVKDGENGLIASCNPESFAQKVLQALDNDYYLELEKNVKIRCDKNKIEAMTEVIDHAYRSAMDQKK